MSVALERPIRSIITSSYQVRREASGRGAAGVAEILRACCSKRIDTQKWRHYYARALKQSEIFERELEGGSARSATGQLPTGKLGTGT